MIDRDTNRLQKIVAALLQYRGLAFAHEWLLGNRMKLRVVVIFSMVIALPAFAHDPSMHKGGDAKTPDCEQTEKMDMGKMDKNDPVMKAVRAKCMAAMAGDHGGHDVKPADKAAVKPVTPEMAMPPMQHDGK